MTDNHPFTNLSENFKHEKEALISLGINSWSPLMNLKDNDLYKIAQTSLATTRNLKRLRCIAMFIYKLSIPKEDAALLMHSGVASIEALAALTPQELFKQTSRLERILKTNREPSINLPKAHALIQKAKDRQIDN